MQIPKEDILMIIGQYFTSIGEERMARKTLRLTHHNAQSIKDHPLLKKNLQKIVKHYATTHQKISKFYSSQQHQELHDHGLHEDEQSGPDIEDEKPVLKESHPRKKVKLQQEDPNYSGTVLKGFSRPKLLETTVISKLEVAEYHPKHVDEPEETTKSKKKSKKSKKVEKQISEQPEQNQKQNGVHKQSDQEMSPMQLNSQPQEEDEPVAKKKHKRAPPKRQPLKCQSMPAPDFTVNRQLRQKPEVKPHQNVFFSRINKDQIGQLPEQLRDNTFHAKFRFGAGDEWGKYGYEKLKDTRGEGFKKQKGKLKNKAFQASGIDINKINSVKLN